MDLATSFKKIDRHLRAIESVRALGINFVATPCNGRTIERALGNTYPVRATLKEHGFRWNPSRKSWERPVSPERNLTEVACAILAA